MGRLNPKRRREMKQRELAQALARDLNPSLASDAGRVRTLADTQRYKLGAIQGPSASLNRGLLHAEAKMPTYAQHKRRKATKKATHVNAADLAVMAAPQLVRDKAILDAPKPLPKKQRRVGRSKIVVVSHKPFSNC